MMAQLRIPPNRHTTVGMPRKVIGGAHAADRAEAADSRPLAARVGAWSGALTAVTAAVALVLGVTTPPRSGAFCRTGCVPYPYLDAGAYVPRDYVWMYPALLAVVCYLLLAVSVHYAGPARRRPIGGGAVVVATLAAVTLAIDYALQLSVMQPALRTGRTSGLAPLSQYNPAGVFIGLEDLGYAAMSVSFVLLGAALIGTAPRLSRTAGWAMTVGGAASVVLLVVLVTVFGADLGSRYEVWALLIAWVVLIVAGALLAVAFARGRGERDL